MNRAVFIDKDGTLVEDIPYNVRADRLRFTEGAIDAMRVLKREGYLLIIISNQSGIARGYFSESELENFKSQLHDILELHGVPFDGFYACPHHPEGEVSAFAVECECRKPKPGMILAAAEDFNVDLMRSWMIGDILNDVEAGNRAGCKTILINNGNETEWKFSANRLPTAIVTNLLRAASRIVHEPELV